MFESQLSSSTLGSLGISEILFLVQDPRPQTECRVHSKFHVSRTNGCAFIVSQ